MSSKDMVYLMDNTQGGKSDMKHFMNLKISAKLIIGFILVALIAGVVGITGLFFIRSINKADTQLYEDNTSGINMVANADVYYQRIRLNMYKIILDTSTQEDGIKKINSYSKKVEEYLNNYNNTVFSEDDKKLYDTLKNNWDSFSSYADTIVKDINNNNLEDAKVLLYGDAQTMADTLQSSFDNLFEYNTNAAKNKSESNDTLAGNALMSMIIIVGIGILLAVLLGLIISRIISKPVNRMVEAADKLALGDVNVDIDVNTKDEIGKLAEAFKNMIGNIRAQAMTAQQIATGDLTVEVKIRSENDLLGKKLYEMVEKNNEVLNNIASASDQVAAGSQQVSDSSVALSQGATEQASSVEELTASLEQISSQTKINAKNASQANELAEIAKSNAQKGNSQMSEMQKAMEEINNSSASISKIIKVIDEIAFQTNILALNAAVEAARAGQHGKGFAVVAEEVRNLAARSANAAKETTDMIEGSIKKVEAGTKIADETAKALNMIVEDVAKAANLVNDIAIASNEQAIGIEQINQGIMQVSQVVQTNSATSQESAAASEELSSQAELLKEAVNTFKLKKVQNDYSQYTDLKPEVIYALENRKDSKNPVMEVNGEKAVTKKNPGKSKIVLTDKEFGKY